MKLFGCALATVLVVFITGLSAIPSKADVLGTVNFDFDSSVLDAEARGEVAAIATRLLEASPLSAVVVTGYTDAVGSTGYNQGLGLRRAQAVAREMVANGVTVIRINTIESRGKTELLVQVSTPERRNRRVNVSLSDLLEACRSYRDVMLPDVDPERLATDLRSRLDFAVARRAALSQTGANSPAYQVAGAAVEDCSAAVGFSGTASRRAEYTKRCVCNHARIAMLGG